MANRNCIQRTFLSLFGAAFILACLGASFGGTSAAEPPDKYHPIEISRGVPSRPGVFEWSPDGSRIVFANKALEIYDVSSGKLQQVDIKPSFVTWYGNNAVLVISGEAGKNTLYMVNTASMNVEKIMPDVNPDAVFTSPGRNTIFLLESRIRVMFIGTSVGYSLFVCDIGKGTKKKIYDSDIIYPTTKPNSDLLHAWYNAGLDPSGGSLLLMEQVKPPASIRPYTRVIGVDAATGRRMPITPRDTRKTFLSGDWSPDGSRVALTDDEGHMDIYSLVNGPALEDSSIDGLYPSWNPRGEQIYLGGTIIDADGNSMEKLFPGDHNSIAEWSPDGTKLAVASGSRLWLLGPFSPRSAEGVHNLDHGNREE